MTLRRRDLRLLVLVVVALIPLLLASGIVLRDYVSGARTAISDDRVARARSLADIADGFVEGDASTLIALAQTPAVKAADAATVNSIISAVLRADPNWLTLGLSSRDGFNISSLTAPARTVNISDRDYFP